MKNSKLLLLGNIICLGISACIHPSNVSKRVEIKQCYELVRDAMVVRTKCPSLMKDYMIIDEAAFPFSCADYVVVDLSPGEQVYFDEVIYQRQGIAGTCWRTFGHLPSKNGIGLVEIPSCFPGYQTPSGWVKVEDGVMEVNPERFRECAQ